MTSPLFFTISALVIAALLPFCAGVAVVSSNNTFERRSGPGDVHTSCKKANDVALTFDDGPYRYHLGLSPAVIARCCLSSLPHLCAFCLVDIARTLEKAGVRGTFFVNGDNWDCIYDPHQVTSLQTSHKAGHQIASHTWSHPDLNTLDEDQIREEFTKINMALQKILGVVPSVIRPPYGNYNDKVRQVASALGQSLVNWNLDSEDAMGATPQASKQGYANAADKHQSTIISLEHETVKTTVYDVLPFAIHTLKAQGYNFVTIAECLGIDAYKSTVSPGRRDATWTC
ncbi:carbohydrate esterase family 4 protein [Gautieria morchelliformis]|nr:carbohydrate esterase family 4 protein [Gautieria morchelliformis]